MTGELVESELVESELVESDSAALDAGDFGAWIDEISGAIRGEHGSDVACGRCTACCSSSQFVHIAPDETDALAHIPPALLFSAPRLPRGHVVLGYDQHGRCPMLRDDGCSIYAHRPRTCRTYDCRIFPATGQRLDDRPDGDDRDKALIARQADRWQFSHRRPDDVTRHAAVRVAATYVAAHPELFEDQPASTTRRAVRAIEIHAAFVTDDGTALITDPGPESVQLELRRFER